MAEEFSRRVARVAVAQLAEVQGFEAVQESAIEVLAELLLRYLSELCTSSHRYAEQANRSDANLSDMVSGLEDMGVSMDDLRLYLDDTVQKESNVPFIYSLPSFPTARSGVVKPCFEEIGAEPAAHIPTFLPAFPDKHTYIQTPAYQQHETDATKQQSVVQQGRQQAEQALVQLHKRLQNSISEVPVDDEAEGTGATAGGGSSSRSNSSSNANPFLSPPLFEHQHSHPAHSNASASTQHYLPVTHHPYSVLTSGPRSGTEQAEAAMKAEPADSTGLDLNPGSRYLSALLTSHQHQHQSSGHDGMESTSIGEGEQMMWRPVKQDDNAGPLRMTEQMTVTLEAAVRHAARRFMSRRQQPDAFALEAARPVRADKRPKAAE
ncbi:MAG: hypothetical protein WDW38_005194 [Sanguina aurantia]